MLDKICSVEDFRTLARKRVPRMFYDYADAGSWTESTYHQNERDFRSIHFRQRVGIDITNRTTTTTLAGEDVTMPVALAPVGIAGMQHADGEILAARAAEAFGIPFILSTMSTCSLEDVATHTAKPFWFQLYILKDRSFSERLLERARAAGCKTLVVTLDLTLLGQRHKDIRNNLRAPPKITPSTLYQFITRPRWCLNMIGTGRRSFGNVVGHTQGVSDLSSLASWITEQFDAAFTWKDLEWIRTRWDGPMIVKGILDPEDVPKAIDAGADIIVVSNHGGRQLDGAPSTISVLPSILEAANGKVEVHLDGGIRSGQDVLKAIALGAKGVHIGRAYIYGLGACGQAGVTKTLEIIRNDLTLTMGMLGERDINQVGQHNLVSDSVQKIRCFT
ncbi:alpha-hydroxy acid oxidase [Kistimonas scapharcae]|uniref:Alpha-hydroxy acid oxidase n=1 Tax=Kistimonas scapharcae TaxID=1036133 RepID=A0ABP8V3Y3_9GAMM